MFQKIIIFLLFYIKIIHSKDYDIFPGHNKFHFNLGDNTTIVNGFQSPINIVKQPFNSRDYPSLVFNNFDEPKNVTISNSGFTLGVKQEEPAFLSGGPLIYNYSFDNLHFHWGSNNRQGSEHEINWKKYPMEAHFVFSRTYVLSVVETLRKARMKYYLKKCLPFLQNIINEIDVLTSIAFVNNLPFNPKSNGAENQTISRTEYIATLTALNDYISWLDRNDDNKIHPCCKFVDTNATIPPEFSEQNITINTVVGVLFEHSENSKDYKLFQEVSKVTEVNSTYVEYGKLISEIVSSLNLRNYYSYTGSLTTPPYQNNVVWFVLANQPGVSNAQLDRFRNLKSNDGRITENWRPIQKLDNRKIYYTRGYQ